ncbi:MAG: beta-ketoacyl-[acyl-carrier-protein] synthase family protein [Gemmataceae bacterium]|nr:beta-ketoacyl-[acyl-carrier-protein] synthase family protein [Gemmataceae bacterium]
MAVFSRRAVITGVGVLTPLGMDGNSFHSALVAGKSGITPITNFDPANLPVRFAGEISDFDAKNFVDKKDRKALRVMARTIHLAVAGAQCALNDAKVDKTKLDKTRFGVVFGAGLIAVELPELAEAARLSAHGQPGNIDLKMWGEKGLGAVPPLWMLKYLPNMLACQVSIFHDAQGPNNSITQSDVAGLLALGESFRILSRNHADFMLTGGAESKINPLSMTRHCLFEDLSRENDNPQGASRPFDATRNGMVLGEGAGVLALEELTHAQARGAKIYGEVLGFGAAFDQKKDGSGVTRALNAALKEARVAPADLDHINGHGLSTRDSDRREAAGICQGLAGGPGVIALKASLGNLGAAGATVELIASLMALEKGVLPGTRNYQHPDAECPVEVITAARPVKKNCFVKISMDQTGQCAAAVIRGGPL